MATTEGQPSNRTTSQKMKELDLLCDGANRAPTRHDFIPRRTARPIAVTEFTFAELKIPLRHEPTTCSAVSKLRS